MRTKYTTTMLERVRKALLAGAKLKDIARDMGVSYTELSRHMNCKGYRPEKKSGTGGEW